MQYIQVSHSWHCETRYCESCWRPGEGKPRETHAGGSKCWCQWHWCQSLQTEVKKSFRFIWMLETQVGHIKQSVLDSWLAEQLLTGIMCNVSKKFDRRVKTKTQSQDWDSVLLDQRHDCVDANILSLLVPETFRMLLKAPWNFLTLLDASTSFSPQVAAEIFDAVWPIYRFASNVYTITVRRFTTKTSSLTFDRSGLNEYPTVVHIPYIF